MSFKTDSELITDKLKAAADIPFYIFLFYFIYFYLIVRIYQWGEFYKSCRTIKVVNFFMPKNSH